MKGRSLQGGLFLCPIRIALALFLKRTNKGSAMGAEVDRSRMTVVLLGVYACMALAKIKPPNEWAQTHYLFSYDLGIT